MKSFKHIWGLAVAMLAATTLYSCSEDEPTYTPADPEGALSHVSFAGSSDAIVEVEPGTTSFTVTLQRPESAAADAESVELSVVANEGNVFSCPATANFAAGETETHITVSVSGAEEGTYYNLSLLVAGTQSNYTDGSRQKNVSFAIMKWENIGKGYWVDNVVCDWFSVPVFVMEVDVEKAVTSNSTRFRFISPYDHKATKAIYIGGNEKYPAYNGYYPYSNVTCQGYNNKIQIICDTKGNAQFAKTNLGIDLGHGDFYAATLYGNYSDDLSKYPVAKYTASKTGGKVAFPAESIVTGMANYNNGGMYQSKQVGALYLSADDFLADHKDVDYANDYDWAVVEEAYGTYVSTAAAAKWKQDVEIAMDKKEGKEIEGLYRFPDLFASGYPLVFNMKLDNGSYLISTPLAQETGMYALGGEMIYAEIKSGKCSAEDMQMTLNIAFYTQDEEGNKLVDFGTLTEEFQWGKTGVSLADLKGAALSKYAGTWVTPVIDLSTGKELKGKLITKVSEEYENTLEIHGLAFVGSAYDDVVYADWDPETGMLLLQPQNATPYDGSDVVLLTLDFETTGNLSTKATLVGGLTEDGVLAFVNNPKNEGMEVQSVLFGVFVDGALDGLLVPYASYPMEWTPYSAGMKTFTGVPSITEMDNFKIDHIWNSNRTFNSQIKGSTDHRPQLIKRERTEVR